MRRNRSFISIVLSLVVALIGFLWQQSQHTRSGAPSSSSAAPIGSAAPSSSSRALMVRNQRIYDQSGRVAFAGDIDLEPTLARIARGQRDPHPNDGAVHRNSAGKLPRQSDPNYYLEYVVRTPNLRGVGPQRLILGKGNEVFYTPDHYQTFQRLR